MPTQTVTTLNARLVILMAAIAIVPALVKLLCYPHNIGSDDAYIHLRIATNLEQGLGWGINPHQPVNLSTAPAFTLLLAAAEAATKHAIGVTQILSVLGVIAGLFLIFLTVLSETASVNAALLAEVAAAFSVNLWRWNGALMEASYGFTTVALVLWMFRTGPGRGGSSRTVSHFVLAGVVLGVGLLVRPEMALLIVLCLLAQLLRFAGMEWLRQFVSIAVGMALPIVPWCLFASRHAGSIFPTTFAAKSTHLHLLNKVVFMQMVEVGGESFLFPALLIVIVLLALRPSLFREPGPGLLAYLIPAGWVIGLSAFYYLKTVKLQSPGRYLLPLLPAEVVLLGFFWASAEGRIPAWGKRAAVAALAIHAAFAIALNYWVVAPSLRSFEGEYAATMRAAADELATLTQNSTNKRVLVKADIGVLSCEANGRFEIFDGDGLASPSLLNLGPREQIDLVRPAFLVHSLGETPDGKGPVYPDDLVEVWQRRFHSHGVTEATLFYYTTIFRVTESTPAASVGALSH